MTTPKIHPSLLTLETSIENLVSLEGNPNVGDVEAVMRSYERFGQLKPIVGRTLPNGATEITAGNTQLAAARRLGWETIAVLMTDHDSATAKAFAIADNRSADLGSTDDALLASMLQEIEHDSALLAAASYSKDEIAELIASLEPERVGLTDPDSVPEVVPSITQVGDLWRLGEHRLVCGDSTDAKTIQKALGKTQADLLITDPPYGVSYADKNGYLNTVWPANRIEVPIINDHLSPDDVSVLWAETWRAVLPFMREGACYYVTGPQGGDLLLLLQSLVGNGFPLRHMLIWVKNNFVLGRSDYNYQHEPIIYGWVKGGHHFYGENNETSTWQINKPHASKIHPTMKPVELWARAIGNSTEPDAVVLDAFAGSGTVVIACQELGRRAVAIELDPHYCDVICRRFEEFTGIKPKRGNKTISFLAE